MAASDSHSGPHAPGTLHVVPKRWFAWDFTILDGERTIAEILHSWWRDAGELVVSGSPYEVRRERFLARTFIVEKSGALIARAERTNRFRHEYVIEHGGQRWALRAHGLFAIRIVVTRLGRWSGRGDEGDEEVGTIWRRRQFLRTAEARLPQDMPLPVKAFVIWLAMLLWKRRAAHAA